MDSTFKKHFGVKMKQATKLGEGKFGTAYRVTEKSSGEERAVKIVLKKKLRSIEDKTFMNSEIKIHLNLRHPHIITLFQHLEDKKAHYLVLELMQGGELFDRIVAQDYFTEKKAAIVVRNITEALLYLHEQQIVHRDLKPENLLLLDKESDTNLKLADFGFAAKFDKEPLYAGVGTLTYVSPDILLGNPYKAEVDIWSLGIILFVLLSGYSPFNGKNDDAIQRAIVSGPLIFMEDSFKDVSESAKDLIRRMLERDQEKRITSKEILEHDWIKNCDSMPDHGLNGIGKKLRDYKAKMLMQRAVQGVGAIVKMTTMATLATPKASEEV